MEKPSYKFWTVGDKYHDMFIRNMKAARGLKKKFKEHIILEAIKSDHFKKIYHIGLKAYGPRGWKYNQVAIEAIKCYDKVQKNFLKKQKSLNKEEREKARTKYHKKVDKLKSKWNYTSDSDSDSDSRDSLITELK